MDCRKFPQERCRGPGLSFCGECLKNIMEKAHKDLTDEDITLLVTQEEITNNLTFAKALELRKNYIIMRALDKKANLKLRTRFQLLKGTKK